MPYADSQDSCTQKHFATDTPKSATTWSIELDSGGSKGFCPSPGKEVTRPSSEVVYAAHRHIVLNKILESIRTEKGQQTVIRRWHQVPEGVNPEEAVEVSLRSMIAGEEAVEALLPWVLEFPESKGSGLALPAPEPSTRRWQGGPVWVAAAQGALGSANPPQIRRVGKQHVAMILKALSEFADRGSGRSVTAANLTIGRRAAWLCQQSVAAGAVWHGRKTYDLAERTLADAVSAVCSALVEVGFMVERARGRHLTAFERVVAWCRHRRYQDRAASVRDLVMPDSARVTPGPCSPRRKKGRRRVAQGGLRSKRCRPKASRSILGLLRTHPHVVRLMSNLYLSRWLLTRAGAREDHSHRKVTFTRPPLEAQKAAARLAQRLPWLLRGRRHGKQHHIGSLVSVVERFGLTENDVDVVLQQMDWWRREKGWEIYPGEIRFPLRWLETALTKLGVGISPKTHVGVVQ